MKNRYDNNPSKDAAMANLRQRRMNAEHDDANAFVKRQESKVKGMDGKAPQMKEEALHFNAYMCNNGEHAQEFGRSLTKGLDKDAFPVK